MKGHAAFLGIDIAFTKFLDIFCKTVEFFFQTSCFLKKVLSCKMINR